MTERSATIGLSLVCVTLFCLHLNHYSEGNGMSQAEERTPRGWRLCPKRQVQYVVKKDTRRIVHVPLAVRIPLL